LMSRSESSTGAPYRRPRRAPTDNGRVPSFRRYVAIGDSFTEGVGDPDPSRPNGVRGWADRVAEAMGAVDPELRHANLAIRGRKMRGFLDEQVDAALALGPDLVSSYVGGNDILRPAVDIDAVVKAYAEGLTKVRAGGAHLVLFTGFDLGWAPVFGRLRGRVAIYNELVREVAEELDATLVDFWRMREYRDPRMWDVDRIHMSSLGHQHMAVRVLDALGVPHDVRLDPLPELEPLTRAQRREADVAWARAHAAPWVQRRLTGRSSGDLLSPKYPALQRPPTLDTTAFQSPGG
jgi:lysophospholipase L1-like esterase